MVYLLVTLLTLGVCVYTIARSDDKPNLISIYLVAWTLVSFAEWWAHSILNLYRYHPGLSTLESHETAWGVLLVEFIFLPSLNVVLAAYTTPWIGAVLGTALVSAMEVIFTRLGMFSYQGWRLWLTLVLFPLYFLAVSLYGRMARRRGMTDPAMQAITRFAAMADFVTMMSLGVWATRLTDSDLWLLPAAESNRSMMRLVVHGTGMLLGYWALIPAQWSARWGRIAIAVIGMIVVNDLFAGLRLLIFLRPLSGTIDAAAVGVITILVGLLTDWINHLTHEDRGSPIPSWEPPHV